MEFVRYIYVRYNGVVDGIHYVGGATEVLPLLNETVASLIYSINNVLTMHSLSPNYQLYYLATNRFGRETKCVISDDDDVQGLLETAEYPMVYVEHNNDPVEEAYIPTFDFGQASGYGDDEAQSSQYETSYHARESAPPTQYFSWDGQLLDESAWNLNEMCGRFNQVRTDDDSDEEAVQPEDEAEEPDDDSDEEDEEYDPTNESGTDSAASEDLLDDDLIEFTATERAGWIRQSRTRHGNPTDSTGELSNWIVPLIPVDATTSLVARESELSRVADLGKNSFYNSKEELVLAVGFWNMKQGAEAKVVRSENDESWKWFLSNVRQTFGQPDNLLVVSDAHNKIKGYGQAVVELFRQAAYAYTDSEFSRAMSAMAQLKPAAYGKLMRTPSYMLHAGGNQDGSGAVVQ
ncbi:uncharacterized protein LOC131008399 [Salvia miltiorrhiza]|uniref:uncharacterized protein LOC131008399 n=1 Tax=Salvia miltiorrhiza TaxID=226208 RepID=UPI0025AC924E|nr:uncharacterized protein LOC131008399 [Salvia miltiorrhiza]